MIVASTILDTFFARRDGFGSYQLPRPGHKAVGRCIKSPISVERIADHLAGQKTPIGPYALSHRGALWCCLDYDTSKTAKQRFITYHDRQQLEAEKHQLWSKHVLPISNKLQMARLHCVVEDSVGGFHLWLLFSERISGPMAHKFAHAVDTACPEAFPKQTSITPGGWGNFVRLPGRYHSTSDWSRIWDGNDWICTKTPRSWQVILSTPSNTPEMIEAWLRTHPARREVDYVPKIATTHRWEGIDDRLRAGGIPLLLHALKTVFPHVRVTSGSRYKVQLICPYHDDHRPSAWITLNLQGVPMIHCSVPSCPLYGNSKSAIGVLTHRGHSFRDVWQRLC